MELNIENKQELKSKILENYPNISSKLEEIKKLKSESTMDESQEAWESRNNSLIQIMEEIRSELSEVIGDVDSSEFNYLFFKIFDDELEGFMPVGAL